MSQIYPIPVKIGNKYGYEDKIGNVVIQPLFDFAREFSEGLAAVKQGICWQFIDLTGNIILDGYPVVYSNGRKANALIYDVKDFKDGTAWILAFADESYRHTAKSSDWGDYITYDKKWGSIDKQGKVVIEPQFDEVPWGFSNGLAPVVMKGLRGFVDKQYKIVVQPQFQKICAFWIEPFSEGWALAARHDKYCYVDLSYKVVLETPFDTKNWILGSFYEDMAILSSRPPDSSIQPQSGYIDKSGNIAIKPQFRYAKRFSEGLAAVLSTSTDWGFSGWGYIDKKGQFVIKAECDWSTDQKDYREFVNGFAQVKDKRIDKSGKVIYKIVNRGFSNNFEPMFDAFGMKVVIASGKYGWIDKSGNIVIQPQFDDYHSFEGEITFVKIRGKWGCINQKGKIVTPPKYDEIKSSFKNGMAAVKLLDKWGYLNDRGEEVIPPKFDEVDPFTDNGTAFVQTKKGFMGKLFSSNSHSNYDSFHIDKTGKIIKK